MAINAWSSQQHSKNPDEVFFQNDAMSLCLLINRRARTMRVIDFRAGVTQAKKVVVRTLAEREGVEKVFTLVERDEVQTWVKLGFTKEGTIPGFYKRSDAFLLGFRVASPETGLRDRGGGVPLQSETRIIAAPRADAPSAAPSAAHERMEHTIHAAKRAAKTWGERSLAAAKAAGIEEADARRAVAVALRSGRALTAFEPFGRDVERRYFVSTVRGGFELFSSAESQSCFGNAFLEVLSSPRNEAERLGTAAGLQAVCDLLLAEGAVACFSFAPSDDVGLAAAFVYNGFRRTGLLLEHLPWAGPRKDAILWSRKLATPTDD